MNPSWYVLYVKTRNELKVAKRLEAHGIQVYCPCRIEYRQWSDRVKKTKVPLLPSMLLVYITEVNRADVFQIPGALRYLFWAGKPATIPEGEIDILKNYFNKHQVTSHEVETLSPGDSMPLDAYGFKNTKGIIEKVSNSICWIRISNLGFILKVNIADRVKS